MKISLSLKNLIRRPARSAALVILTAFLSLSLFGGSVFIMSLRSGLSSLEDRLGADIMVVPYEATTKTNLSNILLQGSTGYFYMDSSVYDKLSQLEGVGEISAQFFLSTMSASCCSVKVQIIGIDPETDFTIKPWIKDSYSGDLDYLEVVVGNDLNAFVGDTLSFYGTEVKVAAKLKKTGTSLDTAVYTNEDTIKTLIQSSLDLGLNTFSDIDPDKVVSCVLINVADGYSVDEVLNDINIHVRSVEAVRTKSMITDVSDSLVGVSDIIGGAAVIIWLMALFILIIVFSMSINERKREFALLRTLGASKTAVAAVVMMEGVFAGLMGSIIGIAASLAVLFGFGDLIENTLGLPFLLPNGGFLALFSLVCALAVMVFSALSNIIAGRRVVKGDAGNLLREVD